MRNFKTEPEKNFVVHRKDFVPAYLKLIENGLWRLKEKVDRALESLKDCRICPRNCGVDRYKKVGVCRVGRYALVSSAFPHFGEERPLRGWRGSGTIFFAYCNLRCVFCQNFSISWKAEESLELTAKEIAQIMIKLQEIGCHNINFVTPEHVVPQVIESIYYAVQMGLRIPIVYNTSSYDSEESLEIMKDVVDIYMPDFKLWNPEKSWRYLGVRDYPDVAKKIVKIMHQQVGDLVVDENGLALRGIILRHLVMPGCLEDTKKIMEYISNEISKDTFVNIMDQYYPAGLVEQKPRNYPELTRRITYEEYKQAVKYAQDAGLWRIYM
ncbi:MAG: radical SAM protein [Candidatus Calescibacterium sp.]|nr:radical SAM protein [Candidatus Calescibacterium sp.]MCX7734946.1 radical SAM protein [bacterium]MDW8088001.1 radical SAM protein [Candidatus Calescibacterium sp.]